MRCGYIKAFTMMKDKKVHVIVLIFINESIYEDSYKTH